jgi:hypothetical protein
MSEAAVDSPKFAAAGAELWDSIAPRYDLRPDELRILADACYLADAIEVLRAAFAADGRAMVPGSMGQLVMNPLLNEQKAHRTAIAGLLVKLKLPDDGAGESGDVSTPARKAAAARWSRGA